METIIISSTISGGSTIPSTCFSTQKEQKENEGKDSPFSVAFQYQAKT